MVRHWLKDQGLSALDDRETRTSILGVSGGVPERLSVLRGLLQQIVADRTKGRYERLSEWLAASPLMAESAGLHLDLLDRFRDFAVLADSDDLTHEDVQMVLGDSGEILGSFFAALGLAEPLPDGGLRLSPLGRIITR